MNNMIKRILSLLSVVIIAMAAVNTYAFSNDLSYKGMYFRIISEQDKTCALAGVVDNVTELIIPDSVYNVAAYPEDDYYTVIAIDKAACINNQYTKTVIMSDSIRTIGEYAFEKCNIFTLKFSKNLTVISQGAFYNACKMEDLVIPEGVTDIDSEAFAYCSFKNISLPKSLKSIGEKAFFASPLLDVVIPESVTSIGLNAFGNSYQLTSITIPASVVDLPMPVRNCYNLKSINVDPGNPRYTSVNGVLFDKNLTRLIAYPGGLTQKEYTVPQSVTVIGDLAFENAHFTSIDLPARIYSIGIYAFSGSAIESITIPDGVSKIHQGVFKNCTNLKTANLSNNITDIENKAFSGCTSLTSIRLPNSLVTIAWDALSKCPLTELDIPNSVEQLSEDLFEGKALTTVRLGSGLKRLSYTSDGFSCLFPTSLKEFYYAAVVPIQGSYKWFYPETYETCTLYVPEEGLRFYQALEPWYRFKNIRTYDFSGVENVQPDSTDAVEVYNLSGVRVGTSTEGLAPGIYIVRSGDTVRKTLVR